MSPTKLELLSEWLPEQDWYVDRGEPPRLARVGGFRLDDPAGEVGMEFVFVIDTAGGDRTTYNVPMTYRGAPLASAADALIGIGQHGVLGRRWIYDGAHDHVLLAEVERLVEGAVQPQEASRSDAVDRSVTVASHDRSAPRGQPRDAAVRIVRVLTAGSPSADPAPSAW